MKTSKRLISAGTAIVCALSMCACGSSSSGNASSNNSSAAEKNTSVADETNQDESKTSTDHGDAGSYDYASLEPVELLAADTTSPGTVAQLFGQTVADKVSEITGGQLTIDYHPNSELGGDSDILRQEQDGDIDIHISQTAPLVSFVPEMGVFDLPMVFSQYSGDEIENVLNNRDSEFRQSLEKAYNDKGFRLLGFLQNATYRMTTANKDLSKLEDFDGLQIRTMENSNHMAFWKAIGASPTPIAYSEVFISLQNGTIDAQENATDSCVALNIQDVQKYICATNHILYLNEMDMNEEKYESLDEAYQAALDQAVSEAIDEIRPQIQKMDEDNLKTLTDNGMTLITYEPDFYDEILNLDSVKALYKDIDDSVNGLGTILQNELKKQK